MSPWSKSSIEIKDGFVFKHDEPQLLSMEALRTSMAHEVGESSGLFSVPKVVSLDQQGSTLTMEFVPGLKNLNQVVLEREPGAEEIFTCAGRALATVHRELRLPDGKVMPLPDDLMSRNGDNVALHGDFYWGNVCWRPRDKQIVLLDWSGAPFLGGACNFGSRYFDLVWFSWAVFVSMPTRRIFCWPSERLMAALICGYKEVEPSFRWDSYARYHSGVWPLMSRFWKEACNVVRPSLAQKCADWVGCLRWHSFPRTAAVKSGRKTAM